MRVVKISDLSEKEKEEWESRVQERKNEVESNIKKAKERVANTTKSSSNNSIAAAPKVAQGVNTSNRTSYKNSASSRIQSISNENKNKIKTTSKSLANQEDVRNATKVTAKTIKASRESNELNKEIEKGGYNKANAIISNTLNNFLGGVQKGTSGIANAVMLPVANKLYNTSENAKKIGILQEDNILDSWVDKILNVSDNISDTGNYSSNVNSKIDNGIAKTLGNVSNSIGNMGPSILANLVAPGSGLVVTGMSAGGNSAQETINNERSNLDKAISTGILKGGVEALTEKLTGGNILSKGSLDDIVGETIAKKAKSEIGKKLLSKGYEFLGEILEEQISDNAGYIIDKLINDKELPDFQEWWNNAGETTKTTFLTTLALNALGLGGASYNDVQQYSNDAEMNKWLNEAQKVEGKEKSSEPVNQQESLPVTNEQHRYSNKLREFATNEINNSNISNNDKQEMLDALNNIEQVTDADIQSIKQMINSITEIGNTNNQLETSGNFKNNNDRRRKYVQYRNDNKSYDSIEVNEVLDITPANRNGNRTVKQWLQVADEIGKRISSKSNEEIERIAYKSWFDIQPTKNITQYDNQAKQKVAFQKLTSDEWINTINNAVNKSRGENNTQTQQTIQEQNKIVQNQISEQMNNMLNNKELPMQAYQYQKSNNAKIDNLRQDASRYFDNSEQTQNYVRMLEKIIEDKNIDIRLDSNLKTADGRIANGSYSNGVITINPNSTRAGEFIAIHELTHAIGTEQLMNIVENYRKSNAEFNSAVENLLQNYNATEITEEALSDVSAQLFGNQEFINSLAQRNPNIFERIYKEIKYLWHQFTGYKNQNQFVEDLYYKWTQAYRQNYLKKSSEKKYSIAGKKAMKNAIRQNNAYKVIENAYNKAKQMAKNGIDNEQIRKQTNWFQDKYGKWKFEFSDSDMSLKNLDLQENFTYNLGDILEHDTLFLMYPDLADLKVEFKQKDKGNAAYNRLTDTITINTNNVNKKIDIEGTLLHEIQHAIQKYEGFKKGSNRLLGAERYYNNLGEIEAADTKNRFLLDKKGLLDIKNNAPESSKDSPIHPNYEKYLELKKNGQVNQSVLANALDSIYNFFKSEEVDEDVQKNKEVVQEDNRRFELVDKQRGLLEERLSEDNSDSFNLPLKDNQGRTLTKEQEKYFKNSKVLDRDGKLKVLYHGTPYEFNTFNYSKLGENTSSLGAGFYFSDNQRTGQEYARGNGNVKEVYVDIKKPLSYGKTTMSKSEYKKFIEKVNEETKGAYLVDYDGIDNALMEYDYGGDDIDLVNAVHNASGLSWEKTYEILRKTTGFDGIISEEGFVNEGETIYVAFNANQIKNINNTNPTENPDIRFSKENTTWQEYLDKNYKATGTRTNLQNIKLPTAPRQQVSSAETSGWTEENRKKKNKKLNNVTNIEEPQTMDLPSNEEKSKQNKIAKILSEPVKNQKSAQRTWAILQANLIDKGAVFETLSLKTNNRELQAKYDATLSSSSKGQYAIGNDRYTFKNGKKTLQAKSLTSIIDEVGENANDFYNYMYHQLNIDRMTLEERFNGDTGINYERRNAIKNKPVFGEAITAEYSRQKVAEYEKQYPEFKSYARDVYDFLDANKKELVDSGVISQELSDKFKEMYPHYVPIARVDKNNNAIQVPLDTRRTGINNPIKKATGGSKDIQPMFHTIADRTLQTYRASARNAFGVELKNTLEKNNLLNATEENTDIDTIIDTMADEQETGVKEGTQYKNPTFTVFENGKKVTYDINQDMYDALKPQNELITKINNSKASKVVNKISNIRRGVLTEYNPLFSLTNAIKDTQDVLQNSQHAIKTYSKFPEAYAQIMQKGYWYNEYIQNGGEQNSYFKDGNFSLDNSLTKAKKAITMPLRAISKVNNVIEMAPRLAEYIASRENGSSVATSMLDASRVTTNFKAGGDITKFANRNGFTFLNAGVQGMSQQIRNLREANARGLKGYAVLTAKTILTGMPALILNNLIWEDDEDYEELQDYVKDSYYIICKIGKNQFIRIPKGRTTAVIQKLFTTADKYITNGREINIDNFAEDFWKNLVFAIDNIAPNNPIDNNIASPLVQVAKNETWYGEDLVPTRLQDVPKAEQYDETTDKFSKWLGQTLNISPMKINYLLDQYGGGVADVLLPLGTPQAENNPIEDKFTTNSIMKNKNPGEFYTKLDELKVNSNSSKATDEDNLKYKYMSSISAEMSNLYKQKREIQNSSDDDKTKKEKIQKVQEQINELAKKGLKQVEELAVNKNTATIGDVQYYKTTNVKDGEETWKELSEEETEKNKNISLTTYASYKEKVAQETIKQRKSGNIKEDGSLKDKDKISILINSNYSDKEKQTLYEKYIKSDNDVKYDIVKTTGLNINSYLEYKLAESNGKFAADKKDDGTVKGKSISGSAKTKKLKYIKSISGANYTQKLILSALEYEPSSNTDKQQVINYVKSLKNKTQKEKLEILSNFKGVTIYKDGTFTY